MEKDIFEWVDWNQSGDFYITYYNCSFKKDFGPYLKNELVHSIVISYDEGYMSVLRNNNEGTDPVVLNLTLALSSTE